MKKYITKVNAYRSTLIAVIISIVGFTISHLANVEFFEHIVALLEAVEDYEVDELLLGVGLVGSGLLIDLILQKSKHNHQIQIQTHRLRVLKATMTTVNDIVNNFLNIVLLFRIEAESENGLSQESLNSLETTIRKTTQKLKTLSDMQATPEKEVAPGIIGIRMESKTAMQKPSQPGAAGAPSDLPRRD